MNFMNFTDDNCLLFFTQGQMELMDAAQKIFYPNLLSDDRCFNKKIVSSPLDEIEFYYKASSKRLKIEYPHASCSQVKIQLYSIEGRLIDEENILCERVEEIDLNTLAAGIYILILQFENNFITHKLFVY